MRILQREGNICVIVCVFRGEGSPYIQVACDGIYMLGIIL